MYVYVNLPGGAVWMGKLLCHSQGMPFASRDFTGARDLFLLGGLNVCFLLLFLQ